MKYLLKIISIIFGLLSFIFILAVIGSMIDDVSGDTPFIITFIILAILLAFGSYLAWTKKLTPKEIKQPEIKAEPKPEPQPATPQATVETPAEQELKPRQLELLYKLAISILEDNEVDQEEAEKLLTWLRRYPSSKNDPRTQSLNKVAHQVLEDDVLDFDESLELFAELSEFCDGYEEANGVTPLPTPKPKAQKLKEEPKADKEKQDSILQAEIAKKEEEYSAVSFVDKLEKDRCYNMEYMDSKGKISERGIIFKSAGINKAGNPFIRGTCMLRNASRTFRADKIQALYDIETGEILV